MFELKKFQNEQFGLIRTMVDDQTQEVVFNGNDVAKALGYVDVKQALRDHTKGGVVLTTPSPGGPQKMKYLTEPDLYRLIMASKLPDAYLADHRPWPSEGGHHHACHGQGAGVLPALLQGELFIV